MYYLRTYLWFNSPEIISSQENQVKIVSVRIYNFMFRFGYNNDKTGLFCVPRPWLTPNEIIQRLIAAYAYCIEPGDTPGLP